jgi:hypothetical protein
MLERSRLGWERVFRGPARDPLLFGLLFTAFTRLVVWIRFVRHLPMSGDESFYWESAGHIADLLWPGGQAPAATVDALVARGWFMPGMSMVLAPARVLTDTAALGRFWIGVLNFGVFVVLVLVLRRRFGARAAWVVWAIGTFMPSLVLFSFSFWGETLAGSLAVLITLLVFGEAQQTFDRHRAPIWIGFGCLLAVLIYLRPSIIVISIVVAVTIVLGALVRTDELLPAFRAGLMPIAIVAATSLVLVAPWTLALSLDKGGFFLTTTSLELGQIIAFGDPAAVEPISTQESNPWYAWDTHIEELAAAEQIPYAAALSREYSRVMGSVSPREYLQRSGRNFEGFLFNESEFLRRFVRLVDENPDAPAGAAGSLGRVEWLSALTSAIWWAMLATAAVFLVWPRRVPASQGWLYVTMKLVVLAILLQPLVHEAHGRHHVVLLSVLATVLAVGLLGVAPEASSTHPSVVVFRAQVGIAVIVVAAAVVLIAV